MNIAENTPPADPFPIPAQKTFFGRRRWIELLVLIAIFLGGAGLRFSDLTQPPLDVHAWRQLRSVAVARQIFYDLLPNADPQVQAQAHYLGVVFSTLEPPLFEGLVARTYLLTGGENIWVARVYSIVFWLVGGLGLFGLAKRMTSADGGLVALAFYLFLPFANTHSRTFLPEPLLVMFMLLGLYAAYRWVEGGQWKWAIAGGAALGLAILVKVFAVYPIAFGMLFFLVSTWGWKATLKNRQVWAFVGIGALIPAVYYLFLIPGTSAGYLETWSIPYLHMLLEPTFYLAWLHKLGQLFNLPFVIFALVSLVLLARNKRWLVVGLWVGYVLEGMTVPSLITSHIYYNLYLTPVIALSLAAGAALLLSRASQQGWGWRILVAAVLLISAGDAALFARKEIHDVDYSQEPAFWQQLSAQLPNDGKIIGLLEDYNGRMNVYGWRYVAQYPYSFDFAMNELSGRQVDLTVLSANNWETFKTKTEGYDYFLVTLLSEFDAQPYLKEILYNYYPVVMEGERCVLFDLRHPTQLLP
jgi:4-amino-4-deoxy-L-arabinose transferase-like glycosyltransferase